MGKLKAIIILVIVAIVTNFLYNIFQDGQLKELPSDGYWGPKHLQSSSQDTKIHPFKINVSESILQSLKSKLKEELNSQRLVEPLEGIGFQYGFNTKYLKTVLSYWYKDYDWRQREKLLNQYPHFKTKIAGIDIHFQHIKPQTNQNQGKYKETKPLLLLHGWPGSFVEFQKVIPLLINPANSDVNFELIIPSLAGFGFSDTSVRPGLGSSEMARIFLKLMQRLGHDQFYVQGGDWGAVVTTLMATRFPEHVLAMHSNLCMSLHPRQMLRLAASSVFPSLFMTTEEIDRFLPFSNQLSLLVRESGYFHLQATKPDTVGVALSQSPGGLLAYIVEKFSTATNLEGVYAEDGLIPQSAITIDQILDNIMIYWVTNTITSSMRFYAEAVSPQEFSYGLNRVPVQVPTGCLQTKDPCTWQSEWMMKDKYPNMIHYTMSNKGGHFLAMEQPEILANDVIKFFRQL